MYPGNLILWLQDGLGILHEVGDADGLASQVTDTQGVYFVPPFAGSDMVRGATDSYSTRCDPGCDPRDHKTSHCASCPGGSGLPNA